MGKNVGHVQLVIHPWAIVEFDDGQAVTTPTVELIELEAGAHSMRLENSHFAHLKENPTRTIEVEDNTIRRVFIDLEKEAKNSGKPHTRMETIDAQ